jgi:PIN domain nuclease of toxin-antitoxin system
MDYILDTHTVLWLAGNAPQLSDNAKQKIFDQTSKKFVSIASAWEIAIKSSIGKLVLDGGVTEFFRMVSENGFVLLPIGKEHLKATQILPFFHRDPFDRLLIATAISEGMGLVSADENIHLYDVNWIW